jgi:phage tail sheath protein FI
MAFLHGIETQEVQQGSKPVNVVKSGVIGLVGIAPTGPKNQVILVGSERDAAQFGKQLAGFSIPQALDVIFAQGAGSILVVNVFDPVLHTTEIAAESHQVILGKLALSFPPIGAITVLDSAGEPSTLIAGTDYSIDEYGNFKALSSAVPNGMSLKFTYKKLNPAAITGATFVGEYDSVTNMRSGLKAFDTAYSMYGINPKILIAPEFSSLSGVMAGLLAAAVKFRGITYIDAPLGTTVAGAIAGRGPAGTFNFNTSNKRVELVYPHIKKYDPSTDSYVDFSYSAFIAGVRAAVDNTDGFWVSTSNKEIKGTIGAERALSSSLSDVTCDINILNEAGITTVFNTFGSGPRTWGNRNASFPTNTGADNFTNIVRAADVVTESLEQAALQFIDRPINQGLIDSIRESGNAFIRVLIGRGAVLPGSSVKYNKGDNPAEELANGHLTFELNYMIPTPGERITFRSFLDISLLASIS